MALPLGILLTYSIGAVATLTVLYKQWLFVSFHFLPVGDSLKKYRRQPTRAWALITGASAGIGLGHAQELAVRGFGVILLGHKDWELDEAIATIKAETPDAQCEKIIMDATTADYTAITAALKPFMKLPITILVNNVAVQTSKPLYTTFESYRPADIVTSIHANNLFMCNITHALYPVLKQNGPSLMINLSSGGHIIGLPLLTIYGGTKAFVDSWTKSMWREIRMLGDPIDCVAIVPGDVASQGNVHGVAPGSPSGRAFAKMVLDRVGRAVERGMYRYSPYWRHALELFVADTVPENLVQAGIVENIKNRAEAERKAS